jgi:hypothetical protein
MMSALKHGTVIHSRFADMIDKNTGHAGQNRYTGELIERSGGGV